MICPECKNEIIEGVTACPTCGYDLNTNKWQCQECHTFVSNEVDTCPVCGAAKNINQPSESMSTSVSTKAYCVKKKKIGITLIIAACILCIIGVTRITNSNYSFYKQHYAKCKAGYIETKSTANSYYPGLLKSTYDEIANSYKQMMDDDMKKINSFKIQAGTCWVVAAGLLVVGIKKERND